MSVLLFFLLLLSVRPCSSHVTRTSGILCLYWPRLERSGTAYLPLDKKKGGGRVEMQLIERATTNEDEVKQPNRHTHTQKRRDANKSEWRLRAELVS